MKSDQLKFNSNNHLNQNLKFNKQMQAIILETPELMLLKEDVHLRIFELLSQAGNNLISKSKLKKFHNTVFWNLYLLKEVKTKKESDVIIAKIIDTTIQFVLSLNCEKHQHGGVINVYLPYPEILVFKFLFLVHNHISREHSVRFYANILHTSPYSLSRATRSVLGHPYKYYIHKILIIEVKSLLTTSIPIKQISYILGFKSPAQLSQYFKKHTAHSLQAFRKSL